MQGNPVHRDRVIEAFDEAVRANGTHRAHYKRCLRASPASAAPLEPGGSSGRRYDNWVGRSSRAGRTGSRERDGAADAPVRGHCSPLRSYAARTGAVAARDRRRRYGLRRVRRRRGNCGRRDRRWKQWRGGARRDGLEWIRWPRRGGEREWVGGSRPGWIGRNHRLLEVPALEEGLHNLSIASGRPLSRPSDDRRGFRPGCGPELGVVHHPDQRPADGGRAGADRGGERAHHGQLPVRVGRWPSRRRGGERRHARTWLHGPHDRFRLLGRCRGRPLRRRPVAARHAGPGRLGRDRAAPPAGPDLARCRSRRDLGDALRRPRRAHLHEHRRARLRDGLERQGRPGVADVRWRDPGLQAVAPRPLGAARHGEHTVPSSRSGWGRMPR